MCGDPGRMSGMLKDGEINLDWSYDQLYDADGMLVGVRQHHSTGLQAPRRTSRSRRTAFHPGFLIAGQTRPRQYNHGARAGRSEGRRANRRSGHDSSVNRLRVLNGRFVAQTDNSVDNPVPHAPRHALTGHDDEKKPKLTHHIRDCRGPGVT